MSSEFRRTGENNLPKEPNSVGVRITMLTPDDWEVLRDMKLKSLRQEPIAFDDVEVAKDTWEARSEQEWRDILSGKRSGGKEGETITLFAKDNGSYVGMVALIIPNSESPEPPNAQHLFVDAEGYRGQGIGRKLMERLIEVAKEKDLDGIGLGVVCTQSAAISLYTSLGFKEFNRIPDGARRGNESYDEIDMWLDLRQRRFKLNFSQL